MGKDEAQGKTRERGRRGKYRGRKVKELLGLIEGEGKGKGGAQEKDRSER